MLICPNCQSELKQDSADKLTCSSCKYSLKRDGNLYLQPDAAKWLSSFDHGFDKRWKQHPRAQATTHFGQLQQKLGLSIDRLCDATVLDVGCGCGRYLSLLGRLTNAVLWGVDVSTHACVAAADSNRDSKRCSIVQAGIETLPFKESSFDVAFSIGVLHHTANPADSFERVAKLVRPGGYLAVWVYSDGAPYIDPRYAVVRDFFHAVTKACPPDALYAAVEKYAVPMRDAYAGEWNILAQVVGASTAVDTEECVSDTFDWHCPQHRSIHSHTEVESWFTANGLDVTWRGDFPASVGGIKRSQ